MDTENFAPSNVELEKENGSISERLAELEEMVNKLGLEFEKSRQREDEIDKLKKLFEQERERKQKASQNTVKIVQTLKQLLSDGSDCLGKLLEELDTDSSSETMHVQDLIRMKELEVENAKLKEDLKLPISEEDDTLKMSKQFQNVQQELARQFGKSSQLKPVLKSTKKKGSPGTSNGNAINEPVVHDINHNATFPISDKQNETMLVTLESESMSEPESLGEEEIQQQTLSLNQSFYTPSELKGIEQQDPPCDVTTGGIANDKVTCTGFDHITPNKDTNQEVHLGMLKYREEDEDKIVKALIPNLEPSVVLSAQPSRLPAYILVMLIRYIDYINDGSRVRSLLSAAITNIKNVMREKGDMIEITVLWLSNILRFLYSLKQYSGDAAFQLENTQTQNEQSLQNFDLSEYCQVLCDHATWIYMMLIRILEHYMRTLAVPAILENIKAVNPFRDGCGGDNIQKPLDTLINKLDTTYELFCSFGLDVDVINQVFRQLSYYLCAGALNNLLMRRELCNWRKGLDIRYNLSALEDWGRSKSKALGEIIKLELLPITQATQILQARKSDRDNDVATICDISDSLTIQQVVKLLNLYTSENGMDADKVSRRFIERVQAQLFENRTRSADKIKQVTESKLSMDTQHIYKVEFPFNSSPVKLEEISIPDSFGVNQWVEKIYL